MAKKSSYKELIQSVNELEKKVTDYKHVDKALKESEEFSSTLLRNSPNPIFVINADTSIRYVNPALERLTGFSSEELIGSNAPYPWWTENTLKETAKQLEESMNTGIPKVEKLFQKKNGQQFWVEITSKPVKINGEVRYCLGNWLDITVRKKAEETLRESEEKYRVLAENSPDLIIRFDRQHRILYVNPAIKRFFKIEPEHLIGKRFREIGASKAMCLYLEDNVQKVFNTGLPNQGVFELEGKDGSIIFDWKLLPEFGKNQIAETAMSTSRDITKLKQTEKELEKRGKELEIKAKNLEEVNTALRVLLKRRDEDKIELEEKLLFNIKDLVMPYLEKLKKSRLDDKQRPYVEILQENLDDIISSFSRSMFSSRYFSFTPSEIQVANLVKNGKTTKEIAELLNLSGETINSHRKNIRRKIGIKNMQANLRTCLASIS